MWSRQLSQKDIQKRTYKTRLGFFISEP
jgi:hypothetical protein